MPGGRLFEPSVNFQNGGSRVRHDFEPTSLLAGTDKHVYNSSETNNLLHKLANSGVEFDTELYGRLQKELSLTKEDIAALETYNAPVIFRIVFHLHITRRRDRILRFATAHLS
jgi:hypothetical protein